MDRFCQKTLNQIQDIINGADYTSHEKYLKLYKLIEKQDQTLASMFDGLSRSSAFFKLHQMNKLDLVESEELSSLSQELQDQLMGIR